jgi:hypothetical protein
LKTLGMHSGVLCVGTSIVIFLAEYYY